MGRVLVIDGDGSRRVALASALGSESHDVELAGSLAAGLHLARTSLPDVVIVESMLPDGDAVGLLARLRAEPTPVPPVVLVVSPSSAESDRVSAFEGGADDYVVRPFSTREVLLRVRALLRRVGSRARPADEVVALGPLRIDRYARKVALGGTPVTLTRREFDLLLRLVDARGRVLTRAVLVTELWPEDAGSLRVVDTTMKRIRRKVPWLAPRLRTVRGVGYELSDEDP